MTQEEIINFTKHLEDFSIEELEIESAKVKEEITRMILDNDAVIRASIIDSVLAKKKGN